jgi:hypothetical protein
MLILPFIALDAAVGAALIVGAAVPLDPLDILILPFMALEAAVGAALMVGAAVPLDPLDIFKLRTLAADAMATMRAKIASTEKRAILERVGGSGSGSGGSGSSVFANSMFKMINYEMCDDFACSWSCLYC